MDHVPGVHFSSVSKFQSGKALIVWFTENPWPPIFISGVIAFVFLAMWNANRRNLHMGLAALFALLCVGIYFAERAIVTDSERLQQRVVQLCEDFGRKDPKTLDYISDSQPGWKARFQAAMLLFTIQSDLRLSDFQTTLSNENSHAEVHFRANATIEVIGMGNVGYHPARVILIFEREKGEWKIVDVKRLNPITGAVMDPLQQSDG